jgi:uncharacterized membrane protein
MRAEQRPNLLKTKGNALSALRVIGWTAVALLFFTSGLCHFLVPQFFLAIMPPYLPLHREAVYVSGAFELLGAFGLLLPGLRRAAGIGLLILAILVTPANVYMWQRADLFPDFSPTLLFWRLPAQALLLVLIYWSAIRPVASAR